MSSLVDAQRKKWGDYESDSEHEEIDEPENAESKITRVHEDETRKEIEEDNGDEGEDEEEDDDDDDVEGEENNALDLSKISIHSQGQTRKPDEKTKNLSKKEKLELRRKELDDLDSILAGFKGEQEVSTTTEPSQATEEEETKEQDTNDGENKTNKKKKKKKKAPSAPAGDDDNKAPVTAASETANAPVNIASVLKAKMSSTTSKSKSTSDPLKIAMEEVLKSSAGKEKKKKRDKSKFSEGSY